MLNCRGGTTEVARDGAAIGTEGGELSEVSEPMLPEPEPPPVWPSKRSISCDSSSMLSLLLSPSFSLMVASSLSAVRANSRAKVAFRSSRRARRSAGEGELGALGEPAVLDEPTVEPPPRAGQMRLLGAVDLRLLRAPAAPGVRAGVPDAAAETDAAGEPRGGLPPALDEPLARAAVDDESAEVVGRCDPATEADMVCLCFGVVVAVEELLPPPPEDAVRREDPECACFGMVNCTVR